MDNSTFYSCDKGNKEERGDKIKKRFLAGETTSTLAPCSWKPSKCHWEETGGFHVDPVRRRHHQASSLHALLPAIPPKKLALLRY
jgi:hypothetical protein